MATKTTKKIEQLNTAHGRATKLEEANTTKIKITLAPAAGRFTQEELGLASRDVLVAAFELATDYVRAMPANKPWCTPSVCDGDTWSGGATAWVTIEHDGADFALHAIRALATK